VKGRLGAARLDAGVCVVEPRVSHRGDARAAQRSVAPRHLAQTGPSYRPDQPRAAGADAQRSPASTNLRQRGARADERCAMTLRRWGARADERCAMTLRRWGARTNERCALRGRPPPR
jgi:hypothetical protein